MEIIKLHESPKTENYLGYVNNFKMEKPLFRNTNMATVKHQVKHSKLLDTTSTCGRTQELCNRQASGIPTWFREKNPLTTSLKY